MGNYLGFKINGTLLCWFGHDSIIYEALEDRIAYNEWVDVLLSTLVGGLDNLNTKRLKCLDDIDTQEEILKHNLIYDDLCDTIGFIKSMKEEIKLIDEGIAQINFLIKILEENKNKSKMECYIG